MTNRTARTARTALLAAASTAALAAATASAAPVVNVDFNGNNGPTQSGFSAFNTGDGDRGVTTLSNTYGGVGVALSTSGGNLFARNRSAFATTPTFTFGDLYRDFITGAGPASADASGNRPLLIDVTGLAPTTQYQVTFYAFDPNQSNTTTNTVSFTDALAGAPLGTITYVGASGNASQNAALASNDQYSLTAVVTSSAGGALSISEVSTVGAGTGGSANQQRAVLNGLQVATVEAVPEPTVAAGLVVGGMGLLGRRRRA